MGLN
jgi:Common central domain of tyrosinase